MSGSYGFSVESDYFFGIVVYILQYPFVCKGIEHYILCSIVYFNPYLHIVDVPSNKPKLFCILTLLIPIFIRCSMLLMGHSSQFLDGSASMWVFFILLFNGFFYFKTFSYTSVVVKQLVFFYEKTISGIRSKIIRL